MRDLRIYELESVGGRRGPIHSLNVGGLPPGFYPSNWVGGGDWIITGDSGGGGAGRIMHAPLQAP